MNLLTCSKDQTTLADSPNPTTRELLALLVEMAPQLSEAGVSRVSLPGVTFALAQPRGKQPEVDEDQHLSLNYNPADPLDDPATYGGKRVPAFMRFRPDFDPGA